jgi:hypothetical protein
MRARRKLPDLSRLVVFLTHNSEDLPVQALDFDGTPDVNCFPEQLHIDLRHFGHWFTSAAGANIPHDTTSYRCSPMSDE